MDQTRKSYQRRQKMLQNYTIALAALSFSIFLMPLAHRFRGTTRLPMYLTGVLFWITFIATIATAIKINTSRRRSSVFNNNYPGLKKLALIHFFQNKPAVIADVAMFVSLLTFVTSRFLDWNLKIQFLLMSMFVFSFGMHCMLNGINYIYIKHKSTVRRG